MMFLAIGSKRLKFAAWEFITLKAIQVALGFRAWFEFTICPALIKGASASLTLSPLSRLAESTVQSTHGDIPIVALSSAFVLLFL